ELARRSAARQSSRRSDASGRRGRAPLRSLAPGRGVSAAPSGRAPRERVSEAHTRRVQEQFGGSAPAYVTSAAHAGGEDLDRLIAWGRAAAPRRVLDLAAGGGPTTLAFARLPPPVTAVDLTHG